MNSKLNRYNYTNGLKERARTHESTTPRAFLRWAGSKRSLVHRFADLIPQSYGTYYEPFMGSGSMFFFLRPNRAVLADLCSDLIDTYAAVRDNPTAIIRYIRPLMPTPEMYYEVRGNRSRGKYKQAAEFIYLNRTCWNGLYRVNLKGEFNVPFGAPKSKQPIDELNIHNCSNLLTKNRVKLTVKDFEDTTAKCKKGDFVFFDPPYVTSHNNNGFIDYNNKLFSWDDQKRLAAHAAALSKSGVRVLVTNADHLQVRKLYPGFGLRRISRASTLASDVNARRQTTELVLYSK